MRFVVDPALSRDEISIPRELFASTALDASQAALRRRISPDMGRGMIDGRGTGRRGRPSPAHLRGGRDTVVLDEPTELILEFTQRATGKHPVMFHGHILEHEDVDMMGPFITT